MTQHEIESKVPIDIRWNSSISLYVPEYHNDKYDSASKMFGRLFCVWLWLFCLARTTGGKGVGRFFGYGSLCGRSMASHFRIVFAVNITFISSLTFGVRHN